MASWTPRNAGCRNSPTSSIGRSCRSSTTTKSASSATPATSAATICALPSPGRCRATARRRSETGPPRSRRSPAKSVREAAGSRDSRTLRSPRRRRTRRSGRSRRRSSATRASRSGCRRRAVPPRPRGRRSPPTLRSPAPRSAPSYSAPIRASAVANSAAPPTPCKARARSSAAIFQAIPHRHEAAVNTTIPTEKTALRPKRSASAPAVRISAANVIAYASTTHSRPERLASSRRWMLGRATFTIVMSTRSMNVVTQTASSVQRRS